MLNSSREVHLSGGQMSPRAPPRVKPNPSACETCHRRKVRCDIYSRGIPCTNCKVASRGDCQIHEKKRKRPALSSPQNRQADNDYRYVGRDHQNVSMADPLPNSQDREFKRHLVQFVDQGDIDKRAIHQGVRITYLGTPVSNINYLLRRRSLAANPAVVHYPTDQISRHLTGMPISRIPLDAFALPEKPLVDTLLAAYFDHVNAGFPVLDRAVFMSQYEGRNPADPPSLLALHTALLVGAHIACEVPGERERLKSMFFQRAKMLMDARFERDRDVVVQAAMLMTWYSDGAEDVCANSWAWVGVAARTALGLGMHRDAGPSNLIEQDKKLWRQTWWMLVQCDVLTSLFYGRPLSINLDDCDVRQLSRADFDTCAPDILADFQINRSALCQIIAPALKIFGPRVSSEARRASILRADRELAKWFLHLSPALHFDAANHSIWAARLMLIYHNFLILLHRPTQPTTRRGTPGSSQNMTSPQSTTSTDTSDPTNSSDASICAASAAAIVTIFEVVRAADQVRLVWLDAVNALFTALTHLSVAVESPNPVLALTARKQFESGLATLRVVADWWPIEQAVVELFESEKTAFEMRDREERVAVASQAETTSSLRIRMAPPGLNGGVYPSSTMQHAQHGQQTADGIAALLVASAAATSPGLQRSHHQAASPGLAALANSEDMPTFESLSAEDEDEAMQLPDWRQLFPFTDADQLRLFETQQQADGDVLLGDQFG